MAGREIMTRRQQSRMAQNQRRKIQRRMARILTEQTGQKVSWKEAVDVYKQSGIEDSGLSALYGAYESQVARKVKPGERYVSQVYGQSPKSISSAIESFTSVRFNESGGDVKRRNEMFMRDIAQSTKKGGLSTLSEEVTHGFYAATQYIWQDAEGDMERNAKIMREFGLNDMKQIYNLVTKDELKKEDFGFNDEELFQQWLDEINERVDLDTLRAIMKEELGDYIKAHSRISDTNGAEFNAKEKWNEKYEKVKVQIHNIRTRTAARLKSRYV